MKQIITVTILVTKYLLLYKLPCDIIEKIIRMSFEKEIQRLCFLEALYSYPKFNSNLCV